MLKRFVVSIVLSLCSTVNAGITGGTVLPLHELSSEQEKIISEAVSAFASQVDAGIVSYNGKGASVGFPLIKTGIRVGDEGNVFLSVSLGYSDVDLATEVEFDSLGDLFDTVLPDFVLSFAFFTSVIYAVLGRRFGQQRPAVAMSAALGMALSIGLV